MTYLFNFGLPDHFWDGFGGALLGAISGGSLAILGAYLANRYLADREATAAHDAEKQNLAAALRIVRYELAAICASIDSLLRYHLSDLPTPVTDNGFRSVQLTIARHYEPEYLTPVDRAKLVNAYALLAFVTRDVKLLQAASAAPLAAPGEASATSQSQTKPRTSSWPAQVVASLESTNRALKEVDDRLKDVLNENLGVPEA